MSLVACIASTGRLHYIRTGATGRLRVRSTTRSSSWSSMRKVRKPVADLQATGRLLYIHANVTGRLHGRLASTGYGRTSHKLASVTGETAWSLTVCFDEIPLVGCHRYAERTVACL